MGFEMGFEIGIGFGILKCDLTPMEIEILLNPRIWMASIHVINL